MSEPAEEIELSEQQRRALDAAGASVALSAGAGCGKTRVLTEKYLRLIDGPEPVPLSRLIVLTFTDKAAREIRDRVRRRCRDRLATAPDPTRWRAVLRGLEAAPIGTFHAFCAQLLRRFSIEAELEPGFGVLDEMVAPSLREEALGRAVRRWLAAANPDFRALAIDRGVPQVRDLVGDLIELRTRGEIEAEAARTLPDRLAIWRKASERAAREAVDSSLAPACRAALALLERHETSAPKMKQRRHDLLETLLPNVLAGRVDAVSLEILRETAKIQGSTAKHWGDDPDVVESVGAALKAIRDTIDAIAPLFTWDEEAATLAAEDAGRLARLALEAATDLDQAKRMRGMLDYDDLILRTRRLLDDNPDEVRAWVERSVAAILVDEYQDTDGLQHEIIRKLAGPSWADGRVFVVGDRKQSIYRFRGAEPDIFDSFQAAVPDAGRRHLTENYRSLPEVIDFINALFAETFPGDEHTILPGRGSPARTGLRAVKFLWAREPDEPGAAPPGAEQRRKVEARWIASLIGRWLDPGSGVTVRDGRTRRPVTAGDIAILFRSMNDADTYETALAQAGLDYHVVGGSAFYGQQEVLDVINVLTAIEDPLDQTALAATLRGPFGGVSDDGLYWLSTHAPTRGDLSRAIELTDAIAELSAPDARKALRLAAMLRSWRAEKDRLPIARVVGRVLDESGVEAAVAGEYLGERRLANLRKLERIARSFDLQGGFTLADFTARLLNDWRKPPREEQAATSEEQGAAVRLMTIHKSKGLEFPIVIVPDLNRSSSHARDSVGLDRDLGVIVPTPRLTEPLTRPPSPGWTIHEKREKHADEQEALRVFYVAATRARDILILSSGTGPDEPPKSPAMTLLDHRFDRATGDFLGDPSRLAAPPLVQVLGPADVLADQAGASPDRSRSRFRPGRLAAAITRDARSRSPASNPDSNTSISSRFPDRARWPLRIDLEPTSGLSSRASRIDRLVRDVLDAGAEIAPDSLADRLLTAARRDGRMTPRSVLEDALRLLDGTIARNWWAALLELSELRPDLVWSIAHERSSDTATTAESTTLAGRIDRAGRGPDGAWRLIALSAPDADPTRERLRLLASAKAAASLGLGPVAALWRVTLGTPRRERVPFDPATLDREIDRTIDALLDPH